MAFKPHRFGFLSELKVPRNRVIENETQKDKCHANSELGSESMNGLYIDQIAQLKPSFTPQDDVICTSPVSNSGYSSSENSNHSPINSSFRNYKNVKYDKVPQRVNQNLAGEHTMYGTVFVDLPLSLMWDGGWGEIQLQKEVHGVNKVVPIFIRPGTKEGDGKTKTILYVENFKAKCIVLDIVFRESNTDWQGDLYSRVGDDLVTCLKVPRHVANQSLPCLCVMGMDGKLVNVPVPLGFQTPSKRDTEAGSRRVSTIAGLGMPIGGIRRRRGCLNVIIELVD